MTTYWKADEATSKKIGEYLDEGAAKLEEAYAICREVGGSKVYSSRSFGSDRHVGFSFADDANVDRKKFVRLKGTPNGWRPRARTDIDKRLHATTSWHCMDIMKLIGMNMMGPGCTVRTPGVQVRDGVAYLAVADDVTPKGCERISDLEWERLTAGKKKRAKKAKRGDA